MVLELDRVDVKSTYGTAEAHYLGGESAYCPASASFSASKVPCTYGCMYLLDPVLKYGKFLGTNAILGPHLGTRKRVVLAQKKWVFILCQDVLG